MSCHLHSKKMNSPEINQAELPESLTLDGNAVCPSSLSPQEIICGTHRGCFSSLHQELGLKLLTGIGADCRATSLGSSSSPALWVCSARVALVRCGTYGGIRLMNVPNRNKTIGFFLVVFLDYTVCS